MLFWFAAAGLTIVATLAAVWPLFRPDPVARSGRADHDARVYRAQLSELESDVARATISAEEAKTARAEIGRRLIRASHESETSRRGGLIGDRALMAVIFSVAVIVPILSAGLYAVLGYGGLRDLPLAARAGEANNTAVAEAGAGGGANGPTTGAPGGGMDDLLMQVEARLAANPDDGRGWEVIAPVYLRQGRPDDAAEAFSNAIRILGSTVTREAGLGEALTQAAGGTVTDPALAAFERALALDETYLPARFFVALNLSQEDRYAAAETAWTGLIADSPDDAPWLRVARPALAEARDALGRSDTADGTDVAAAPAEQAAAPGPNEADVVAAGAMDAGDRTAMIEGMVARLAERLESDPRDVDGWKRLIRSYAVLGDTDRARKAYRTASATFGAGSDQSEAIRRFADEIGLSREGADAPGETGREAGQP